MKGILKCQWMCEGCDDIHDTEWDAQQCCPPEVTEIWRCPICSDIHYEEQGAILCCGFDPDAPPPPPSAEELERAGQMRLVP